MKRLVAVLISACMALNAGSFGVTNSASPRGATGASVLNHQSTLAAVGPMTGSDTTFFTYTLPANTMGAAGCIHVEFVFNQTVGGGTSKFWFGTTSIVIYPASGDTSNWVGSVYVCNNTAATGAQQIVAGLVAYAGASAATLAWNGGVFNTSSQDTTAAVVIKMTGTGGTLNFYTPVSFNVW